ncbi:MAG: hypothetical protein HGA39_01430 [Coriobacteriia bacterium]|nr:hypothetical protein [Coriobacteriia bacterium]
MTDQIETIESLKAELERVTYYSRLWEKRAKANTKECEELKQAIECLVGVLRESAL